MIHGLLTILKNFLWQMKNMKMKNRFLQLSRNLYQIRLKEIIVKSGIYVIFDKYEFLCSHFLIHTRFLKIILTLKIKIIRAILKKCFFHTNKLSLLRRRTRTYFSVLNFKPRSFLKTASAVWVPKHSRSQKYFFSISIQLKLSQNSTLSI